MLKIAGHGRQFAKSKTSNSEAQVLVSIITRKNDV